jgi:hypothetical protein
MLKLGKLYTKEELDEAGFTHVEKSTMCLNAEKQVEVVYLQNLELKTNRTILEEFYNKIQLLALTEISPIT